MKYSRFVFLSVLLFAVERPSPLTRDEIMQKAKQYAYLEWTCYSPFKTMYIADSSYIGMAYRYGGNDSLEEFIKKVEVDKLPPVDSAGIDCSAFVSRAWHLCRPYVTGELEGLATFCAANGGFRDAYTISFDQLVRGDIMVDSGWHAVLFDRFNDTREWVYAIDALSRGPSYIGEPQNVSERRFEFSYLARCTARSLFDPSGSIRGSNHEFRSSCPSIIYTKGNIIFYIEEYSEVHLNIIDLSGRIFLTHSYTPHHLGRCSVTIPDIRNLPSGLYHIDVNTNQKSASGKLAVVK